METALVKLESNAIENLKKYLIITFFFQNIESNSCLKRVCFSMKEYNWQQGRSTKCTKLSLFVGFWRGQG